MKKLFLLFLLAISLNAFGAEESVSYDWLMEQYRNDERYFGMLEPVEGRIDDEEYVAIGTQKASPTDNSGTAILIFRKATGQFDVITKVDISSWSMPEIDITIKNNSLFIEGLVAHHGLHGKRYQFKRINGKFRLIGMKWQHLVSLACHDDDESPPCGWEGFSGNSYNFLTSSALCWQDIFNPDNKQRFKEAIRRFHEWLQPKGGVRHQMTFRPIDLPLMDGFAESEFSSPESCYFDGKNKLHISK
jgi:hypothetical protein